MPVTVQYASRVAGLPTAARLRRWVKAALAADALDHGARNDGAQINLRFVNAAEGRVLNREYRGKDYATNVLTFPYGEDPVEADIVLCAAPSVTQRARINVYPMPVFFSAARHHGRRD